MRFGVHSRVLPVNSQRQPGSRLRFGSYEFDAHRGELWKGGRFIPLQPQPARVLSLLLTNPGETVLREEFQSQVWGGNPSIDIDQSLNFCIRRLRATLHDRPESPRYIETVPRRGYRFIATVSATSPEAKEEPRAQIPETGKPGVSGIASPDVRTSLRFAVIVLAILSAAAAAIAWLPHPTAMEPAISNVVRLTDDGNPKVAIGPCCTNVANDGENVYFSEMVAGHWILARVPAHGGEVSPIPTPLQNAGILDVSAGSHSLLVRNYEMLSPVWAMPAGGGTLNQLGNVQGNDAAWSPDGLSVVYVRDYDLYVADSHGAGAHRIAHLAGPLFRPRWSPDGKRLRVAVYDFRTGLNSLWEVALYGGAAHPLFAHSTGRDECCGVWTPDGRYFVYQSKSEGFTRLRVIREADVLNGRIDRSAQLTTAPLDFLGASPSPDGSRLFAIGQQKRGELMQYDRASGKFVTWMAGLSAEGLAFSKDGSQVVWCSYPEAELWRSRADGTNRIRLTPSGMFASLPHWSPDERRILFTGSERGKPVKAYVVNAEGGNPETVVPGAGPEFDAGWSPDGRRLVYADSITADHGGLHLMDLRARQVSTLAGSEGLFSPRWSPDGRYIAALTNDSLNLRLFDRKTGRWRDLVHGRHVAYPSWSRDSRGLYFFSPMEAKASFFRVSVPDAHLELVTDAQIPWGMAAGTSGFWSGVDRGGTPVVLRDASIQEVYALDLKRH